MADRRVVVCVPRAAHLVSPLDGFSERYRRMIAAFAEAAAVHVVVAAHPGEATDAVAALAGGRVTVAVVPSSDGPVRRSRRASAVARSVCGLPPTGTVSALLIEARRARPDLLVLIAPGDAGLRWTPLMRGFPTMLIAEEDLSGLPQFTRPVSLGGRLLHRVERHVFRRRVRGLRGVVVISPDEVEWARSCFRAEVVSVVPHSIDPDYWSAAGAATQERRDVVAVGHFGVARNHEGLRDVITALQRRPQWNGHRLRIISSAPPPNVDQLPPWVEYLGPLDDPRPVYRTSAACLVPSLSVSGVKTTILQGWAMSCPVVAATAAARSVRGEDGVDLLCSPDGEGMADRILELLHTPSLGESLAEGGRRSLIERHAPAGTASAFRDALGSAFDDGRAARPPQPSRGERTVEVLRGTPTRVDVSVIIPAHNAAGVIGDQLDAVLAQRADCAWELIVVLNCCTDDTAAVVRRHCGVATSSAAAVRLVHADEQKGTSWARNAGVEHATGELLVFCDADDVVAPGWLAAMVAALATADLVGARAECLLPVDDDVRELFPRSLTFQATALPSVWNRIRYTSTGLMGCRRAALEAAGGFDDEFPYGADDIAFAMRLQRAGGRIAFAGDAVVSYRLRSSARLATRQQIGYVRGLARLVARYAPEEDEGLLLDVLHSCAGTLRALVPLPRHLARRRRVLARIARSRVRAAAAERRHTGHPLRPAAGPGTWLRLQCMLALRVIRVIRVSRARRVNPPRWATAVVRRHRDAQPLVEFTVAGDVPEIGGLGLMAPRSDVWLLAGWSDLSSTLATLPRHLRPGATVVDVGANIGQFAVAAARAVGADGVVVAFEPVPQACAALRQNLGRHAGGCRVEVHECAVAAGPGRVSFNTYSNGLLGSMRANHDGETVPIDVAVVALDDVLSGPVDVLKIDVEGSELAVLAGARRTLAANPDAVIIIELALGYLTAPEVGELLDLLSARGELWIVEESGGSPLADRAGPLAEIRDWIDHAVATGSDWYANVLVVPPSRQSLPGG